MLFVLCDTYTADIVHRDIKPSNVLVSGFHCKRYNYKNLDMVFGKKSIARKLGDLGEARSLYTQTNALTGKNCTTAVHTRCLAFMVPEFIIVSAAIDELKTVDVWTKKITPIKQLQIRKQLLNSSYSSKLILPLV